MSNSLGCIQHTATAYPQYKICLKIQSLLNTLSSLGHQRIWLHAPHGIIRQTGCIQLILQLGQQTTSHYTATTVNDEHSAAPMLFNFICSLAFSPLAKNNLRWAIVLKTLHKNPSYYYIALPIKDSPAHYPHCQRQILHSYTLIVPQINLK